MRYTQKLLIAVIALLSGCAANEPSPTLSDAVQTHPPKMSQKILLRKQIDSIQNQMMICMAEVNKSDDAKYVDEHILVLTPNNPNAKELFNSTDKIASDQAAVLKRFKDSAIKCRALSSPLPSPDLVEAYKNFYLSTDLVYKDLIDKKITIGVANQERAMQMQYTKNRITEILRKSKKD